MEWLARRLATLELEQRRCRQRINVAALLARSDVMDKGDVMDNSDVSQCGLTGEDKESTAALEGEEVCGMEDLTDVPDVPVPAHNDSKDNRACDSVEPAPPVDGGAAAEATAGQTTTDHGSRPDTPSSTDASDSEDPAVLRRRLRRLRHRVRTLQSENSTLRARLEEREDELDRSLPPQQRVEEIKQAAAETAARLEESEMVYQQETGLYYHHGSGFYWDPVRQMYYDGDSGYYLTYDADSGAYSYVEPDTAEYGETAGQQSDAEALEEGEIVDDDDDDDDDYQSVPCEPAPRARRGRRWRRGAARYNQPSRPPQESSTPSLFCSGPIAEVTEPPPPWLRMIVTETEVQELRLGSLHVATVDGLTVGRDPSQQLVLHDANVSKFHAVISYSRSSGGFCVRDLGSRNGSFVDGRRISAAKQESEETPLPHGCQLRLGSTLLTCHVHADNDTCLDCEPGEVQSRLPQHNAAATVDPRQQRRQVADAIKQKYGLRRKDGGPAAASGVAAGYSDRAEQRRTKKGSSHPSEKTETADPEAAIPGKNRGFQLLQSMGWKEGQGLGREAQGRVEPVIARQRGEKRGLGCEQPAPPPASLKEKRKTEVWQKTQERFKKLV